MKYVETDPESGVEIYRLTHDVRPADNVYGEQPYSDPSSRYVAIRFYPNGERDGELAFLSLENGELRTAINENPRFPAFHPWSKFLYCQQAVGDDVVLRRWRYDTLECDDIVTLPKDAGGLSYGTVSPDHAFYATSVVRPDDSRAVILVDLESGKTRTLVESDSRYHFKHEQFSRDGANRILIQADVRGTTDGLNPDWEVHLGWIDIEAGGMTRFAVDRPYTPPSTGHECWIGGTDRIFFSTLWRGDGVPTMFTAGVGDTEAQPVAVDRHRWICHVSTSSCGRYWVADATEEPDIPIYAGAFGGSSRRLLLARTVGDGNQWSHTHPYLTADNRWLIFTARRDGHPAVYGARVPYEFWESLIG